MPPILFKALAGLAGAVALCFVSFQWGRADQRGDYLKEMAALEREHAQNVAVASEAAYKRGVEDSERRARNQETFNDLSQAARAEDGADDLCWSADSIDRLRELQ